MVTFGIFSKNSDEYKYKSIGPSYPPVAPWIDQETLYRVSGRQAQQAFHLMATLGEHDFQPILRSCLFARD